MASHHCSPLTVRPFRSPKCCLPSAVLQVTRLVGAAEQLEGSQYRHTATR